MSRTTPAEFIRQVRRETSKVTWPSRKEVMVSTVVVLVLATIAALFFMMVDAIVGSLIRWILGV